MVPIIGIAVRISGIAVRISGIAVRIIGIAVRIIGIPVKIQHTANGGRDHLCRQEWHGRAALRRDDRRRVPHRVRALGTPEYPEETY